MKSSPVLRSCRVFPNLFGTLLLIAAAPALAACNSITGAGDLEFTAGGGGSGDDWGNNAAAATTGSSSPTSSGAGASGASSSAAAVGASSSAAAGGNCTYPTGSYGATMGSILNPNLHWQGYREGGATTVSDIAITEYFDCDGSRGIHALYIATSATWCGNCQQEASEFPGLISSKWGAMGIKVLTLMIENQSGAPATTDTALQWRDYFGLTAVSVVADPSFSMAGGGGTVGLPLLIVVDPRNMTVVDRQEGYSGYHGALESLAQQNATP